MLSNIPTERSWLWKPLRRILFNTAPITPAPAGGSTYVFSGITATAGVKVDLFSMKMSQYWAQIMCSYVSGNDSSVLTGVVQGSGDLLGAVSHELDQSAADVMFDGAVAADGTVTISATASEDCTIKGTLVYTP